MAKREKKTIISGVTREVAEEAFAAYAVADAQSVKIKADIELQCAKIREKYANRLSELDDEKAKAFETLQSFAVENQAELFTKKKSLDMTHGVIGFRTGTPKLKTLKGFTWALKILSCATGLINKAFGSLTYDQAMSEYKEEYRKFSLAESIEATEK